MVLEAHDIVGTKFPPEEGMALADAVLLQDDWPTLEIDLRQCPAALLISGFFNGFLQRIADKHPGRLRSARRITWLTAFEFQSANILYWIDTFVPRPPCTPQPGSKHGASESGRAERSSCPEHFVVIIAPACESAALAF